MFESTFNSGIDGWSAAGSGATITQSNGRLKITATNKFTGAGKYMDVSPGDVIDYNITIDKGTTQKIILYLVEYDSNYNHLKSIAVDLDANGYFRKSYTIQSANKLRVKLEKHNSSDNGTSTYFYIDDVVFSKSRHTGDAFNYVYQYKDHLGNVRLSYTDNNNDGVITPSTEIIEESNYYPFGLKHKGYNGNISSIGNSVAQKFGYNGVELNESLGLNLMEMDFRQYDPAIGRFTSIDPVVHWSNSTYNGFDNNPVYWADPSGADSASSIMDAFNKSGSGTTTWYNDGNGGLTDEEPTDPKEGESREVKKAVCGVGKDCVKTYTEYYHSGGIKGSKAGWYRTGDYIDKITPLAITLAGGNDNIGGSLASLNWIDNLEASDGFWNFLNSYSSSLSDFVQVKKHFMTTGTTNSMGIDSPFLLGVGLLKNIGLGGASVTTTDGFLFKGFTVKTPIDIPVQRFGNLNFGRADFWGLRIGTSQFANRTFGAILPEWNSLTQFTKGVIPKGSQIKFGFIGPQGWKYPGGSLQFIVRSKDVINQSSKIIKR